MPKFRLRQVSLCLRTTLQNARSRHKDNDFLTVLVWEQNVINLFLLWKSSWLTLSFRIRPILGLNQNIGYTAWYFMGFLIFLSSSM
jgi:hypothetical protein